MASNLVCQLAPGSCCCFRRLEVCSVVLVVGAPRWSRTGCVSLFFLFLIVPAVAVATAPLTNQPTTLLDAQQVLSALANRQADIPDNAPGDELDDDVRFRLPDAEEAAGRKAPSKNGGFLLTDAGRLCQERVARLAAIKARDEEWRVRLLPL